MRPAPLRPWSDPRQEATTSEGEGAHDVWDRIFALAHAGTYIGERWDRPIALGIT